MLSTPVNAVTTKFVRAVSNKIRCPILCTSWVPDGRRVICGAHSGELTLWNGINLSFESALQVLCGSSRSSVVSCQSLAQIEKMLLLCANI